MRTGKLITRKSIAGAVSTILAVSLILGGTLAYQDYTQHAANEFSGTDSKHAVHLIEDFKEVKDWKVADAPIKKEIRVRNMGGTEDFPGDYEDVYVRLQLKEYMEIAKLSYEYSDSRLMINTEGAFYAYDTEEAAKQAFPGHKVEKHTALGADAEKWYVVTQAHDDNGQYGRFLILDSSLEDAKSLVPGVIRAVDAATIDHHENKNGECDYTIHKWDGNLTVFEEYIKWFLGDNVIKMEDWDGKPTAKWILDTNSAEGWVYWGEALKPGAETSNLLEKVSLIKQPDGGFYYTIHTDMQAVSYDELGLWTDMPTIVSGAYNTPSAPQKTITAATVSAAPNKTSYVDGDSFDPSGMSVTVTYDDGGTELISYPDSRINWSPKVLSEADTLVTVSVGGVKDVTVPITVTPAASQQLPVDITFKTGVDGRTIDDVIHADGYDWRIIGKDANGNMLLHCEETTTTTIFGSNTTTYFASLIGGTLSTLTKYARPAVTFNEEIANFATMTPAEFKAHANSAVLSYVDEANGTKQAFYLNLSELNTFSVKPTSTSRPTLYERSYKVNTTGTDTGATSYYFLLCDPNPPQGFDTYHPISYVNGIEENFKTQNRPAVWVKY